MQLPHPVPLQDLPQRAREQAVVQRSPGGVLRAGREHGGEVEEEEVLVLLRERFDEQVLVEELPF